MSEHIDTIDELSAQWANNPEPEVGKPDPRVTVENVIGGSVYVWHSGNTDAWITYDGEAVDVEQ